MNLKNVIPQIYEYRIIQSTKAIISCFIENAPLLPKYQSKEVNESKEYIDYVYDKILKRRKRLSIKEINNIVNLFSLYSYRLNELYNKRKIKESKITKYSIYYIANKCVREYYRILLEEKKEFNGNMFVEKEMIDTCDRMSDMIMILITLEQAANNENNMWKSVVDEVKAKLDENIDFKDENIKNMEEDLEEFLTLSLDDIFNTVKSEYKIQLAYIKKDNSKLLNNNSDAYKNLLLDVKNYEYKEEKK